MSDAANNYWSSTTKSNNTNNAWNVNLNNGNTNNNDKTNSTNYKVRCVRKLILAQGNKKYGSIFSSAYLYKNVRIH